MQYNVRTQANVGKACVGADNAAFLYDEEVIARRALLNDVCATVEGLQLHSHCNR